MKRKILTLLFSTLFCCTLSFTSFAFWKQQGEAWNYVQEDSTIAANKWMKINDLWYHFSKDGIMETGWIKLNEKWYYLDNVIGYMKTGWFHDDDGSWYYLDEVNGNMWVNKRTPDGYYVNKSGVYDASKGNNKTKGNVGPASKIIETKSNTLLRGVEFPALSSFATDNFFKPEWGVEGSLEAINSLNIAMENSFKIDQTTITYTQDGMVKLKLVKENDHYVLYDYGSFNNDMETALLAMCNLISSTPQSIYNAIYQAAEYDQTIMRSETFTDFGDGKILYTVFDNYVSFTIAKK